ncbi:MAG: efflux RND transporter periplasmic adaptor subunit [Bacteroidales bacterium]|nr:efflux RND transporter periplasmic adaptor subunit [Bacteroidales bacterium]
MNLKYFVIIAFAATIMACSNEETSQSKKESNDVPPSLQKEQSGARKITLTPQEVKDLDIQTKTTIRKKRSFQLVTNGITHPAPNYISQISAPVDGRIVTLAVNEGERVRKGQVIIKLESLEYGRLVSNYIKAAAETDFYKNRFERIQKLVEREISSESELEKIESDYKRAMATENAAKSMLRAVGVSNHEIEKMKTQDDINPVLSIKSPINGVVNEHLLELGQSVKAYEKMASLINMDKVLVKAFINPGDGQYVNSGDSVVVNQRVSGKKSIKSTISTVNPTLDMNNRSVVANIPLKPQNNWPMPGENVRIEITTDLPEEVIAIPMEAVTYDDDKAVVFVRLEDNKYEKRFIEINESRGNYAIVRSGLKENEEIAISQVFSLKALARYEQFAE